MRRVLIFVGAFGDFACTLSMLFGYPVASCCGIPTQVTYYFDQVSCYVCAQLGIFSRSYYVLIMGFLARSVVWRFQCVCSKSCLSIVCQYLKLIYNIVCPMFNWYTRNRMHNPIIKISRCVECHAELHKCLDWKTWVIILIAKKCIFSSSLHNNSYKTTEHTNCIHKRKQ
jgi:hypothetical protein